MFGFIHYYNNQIYNSTVNYYSTDTGKPPELNPDWTEDFNYRFNSLGFRSNEILPKTACVVTFGCSHAVGVGVPEEKRFGDIIANKLGYNPYNFGVSGADFYIILHNILTFVENNLHNLNVKYIIILWPEIARFSWFAKDLNEKNFITTEVPRSIKKDSWQENFIINWQKYVAVPYLFNSIRSVDTIFKNLQIPVFQQLSNNLLVENEIASLRYDTGIYNPINQYSLAWDRGRDTHFGPLTHQKIADSFLQFID